MLEQPPTGDVGKPSQRRLAGVVGRWLLIGVVAVGARELVTFFFGDGRVVEVRTSGRQDAGCRLSITRSRWLANSQKLAVDCNTVANFSELRVRCTCAELITPPELTGSGGLMLAAEDGGL